MNYVPHATFLDFMLGTSGKCSLHPFRDAQALQEVHLIVGHAWAHRCSLRGSIAAAGCRRCIRFEARDIPWRRKVGPIYIFQAPKVGLIYILESHKKEELLRGYCSEFADCSENGGDVSVRPSRHSIFASN